MADPRNPLNYPLNPDFGKGIYRRKTCLINHDGWVEAAMEDCNHGFCVELHHDGQKVTKVEAEHKRIPFTTCGGASEPLQSLVGMPLGLTDKEMISRVDPKANCTHWLDLALLAILHASRDEIVREYLMEVPDENDRDTTAKIFRNGEEVHSWVLRDWVIQSPEEYAGATIFRGFAAWANATFEDPEAREAAFALQKAYFVSRARRFDINNLAGDEAKTHHMMIGACFSYSEPQVSVAVRTSDSLRDFTDTPEELLLFK